MYSKYTVVYYNINRSRPMTLYTFYTIIGDHSKYTQNTLKIHGRVLWHKPVTTDDFINVLHNYRGSGRPASVYWYVNLGRALPTVRIIVPSLRMVSVQPTTIAQLISEQYMVELPSPTGRDMIFVYLADYVNTLSPTWYTLYNNTNPSGFSHIYTRKVLLPHG